MSIPVGGNSTTSGNGAASPMTKSSIGATRISHLAVGLWRTGGDALTAKP
jgi:hypothetical protein